MKKITHEKCKECDGEKEVIKDIPMLSFSDFNKGIGGNIRKYRNEKGLSLEDLCKICDIGLSKSTLSLIEIGAQNAYFYQAFIIAKALGVSILDLIPKKEVPPGCCQLCGKPMPPGEEMFKYHGYSGDCPSPTEA